MDALVWILRVLLFRRCNSSAKVPLKYATDHSILLGLMWAAEIGLGTAACILTIVTKVYKIKEKTRTTILGSIDQAATFKKFS